MKMTMSPAKMVVAKLAARRDLDRNTILALEEFERFEFIDVPRQANITEIERTRKENRVFEALDRINSIIESLDLDANSRLGKRVGVDNPSMEFVLNYAGEVIDAVESKIELLDAQKSESNILRSLQRLGLEPKFIGDSEYTFTAAGRIESDKLSRLDWSLREVTDDSYMMRSLPAEDGYHIASVSVPKHRKDAAQRIFSAFGFEPFEIPKDEDGEPIKFTEELDEREEDIERELRSLEERRNEIIQEWGQQILASRELLFIERQRIETKKQMVYTESSVKAWGWVPDGHQEDLREIMQRHLGSDFELNFEQPDFSEEDSPIYLDNPSVMNSAEDVVKSYGVPSKHDLDPTKIMFLSFPIIFGLVFADVGQGLLILIIGLAAWRANKRGDDWGQILGYLQNGATGLIMMGIFAMVGGFLFGSFFGSETVIEPLWHTFAHTLENGEPNPYRPSHMLKLSIEVGVIQISLGIILSLYNNLKHKHIKDALVSLFYLWFYLGFIILIFGVSYNNINAWFSMEGNMNIWLPIVGIGYGTGNNGVYPAAPIAPMTFTLVGVLIPMILMALLSLSGGMDSTVHFMESAIGSISHTVSYARIFALNTVHIILSGVFFSLIPAIVNIPFPPISIGGLEIIPEHFIHDGHEVAPHLPLLGAIIGTFIVGILEGLLAFMHTLRLHFVEWFSKFYHAGGTAFNPFKAKRIHTSPPKIVAAQT